MPFPVHPQIGDDRRVHIGSKICLRHLATRRYIRSTAVNYQSGSGQQLVYALPSNQPEHEDCQDVRSPSSGQNEVSTYGAENLSDANDIWIVEKAEGGCNGQEWDANDVFLLRHERTGAFLHSHDIQVDINGRKGNEVTTFAGDRNDQNNQLGTRFG
ncbi:hypothetical protein FBU30_010367 [Linnemannia zychae]|nr:hypothetical protein FBU30_010367 [Linnemannia zychae]